LFFDIVLSFHIRYNLLIINRPMFIVGLYIYCKRSELTNGARKLYYASSHLSGSGMIS